MFEQKLFCLVCCHVSGEMMRCAERHSCVRNMVLQHQRQRPFLDPQFSWVIYYLLESAGPDRVLGKRRREAAPVAVGELKHTAAQTVVWKRVWAKLQSLYWDKL